MELAALDRQGTRQQRPESHTVTPPGMQVITGYNISHSVYVVQLLMYAPTN